METAETWRPPGARTMLISTRRARVAGSHLQSVRRIGGIADRISSIGAAAGFRLGLGALSATPLQHSASIGRFMPTCTVFGCTVQSMRRVPGSEGPLRAHTSVVRGRNPARSIAGWVPTRNNRGLVLETEIDARLQLPLETELRRARASALASAMKAAA